LDPDPVPIGRVSLAVFPSCPVLTFFCVSAWIMFLVAAIMQGFLLIMCICWKVRQQKLRIDDFGHPLRNSPLPELPSADRLDDGESVEETMEDGDAMEEDIVSISPAEAEQAALLGRRKKRKIRRRGWLTKWLGTK
jgi:hypothetical protein